jgi:hypothetical protein
LASVLPIIGVTRPTESSSLIDAASLHPPPAGSGLFVFASKSIFDIERSAMAVTSTVSKHMVTFAIALPLLSVTLKTMGSVTAVLGKTRVSGHPTTSIFAVAAALTPASDEMPPRLHPRVASAIQSVSAFSKGLIATLLKGDFFKSPQGSYRRLSQDL